MLSDQPWRELVIPFGFCSTLLNFCCTFPTLFPTTNPPYTSETWWCRFPGGEFQSYWLGISRQRCGNTTEDSLSNSLRAGWYSSHSSRRWRLLDDAGNLDDFFLAGTLFFFCLFKNAFDECVFFLFLETCWLFGKSLVGFVGDFVRTLWSTLTFSDFILGFVWFEVAGLDF